MAYKIEQSFPLSGDQDFAFHVTSSSEDLLNKVQQLLHKRGMIGISDLNGRVHYVVEGRRGAVFAGNCIEELSKDLRNNEKMFRNEKLRLASELVERVLSNLPFKKSLLGYQYIRHMLVLLTLDQSLLRPLSKKLYPITAKSFSVSIGHVERNVRYCIQDLQQREDIIQCRLVLREAREGLVFAEGSPEISERLIPNMENYTVTEVMNALYQRLCKTREDKKKPPTEGG